MPLKLRSKRRDDRVEQIIRDPKGYFARARANARAEVRAEIRAEMARERQVPGERQGRLRRRTA